MLVALTQVTMHFRQRLSQELGENVVRDLRRDVFRHLVKMPMSYFNKTKLGRIISHMTSDIEAMRQGVQSVLFVAMVQLLQMIGAGVFMAISNWRLFSVIVLMSPVLYALNRYFRKRISKAARQTQESFSRVTASLAESVKGIRVTQGFSREDTNAGIFRRLVVDHSRYNVDLARNQALLVPALELNSQFFIAVTLLIGGYGALTPGWDMPVGELIIFFFLAQLFFAPISVLANQFTAALASLAGAERIFRLLDEKPEWTDDEDAVDITDCRGEVEFRKVTFGYDPQKPVLHDLNFKVNPGESIALVGHTGSGKSSIINLVCKFYLPTEGEIFIDGREIRKITQKSLHRQLGIVLQQNFLFTGTVMDNIRRGKIDATDDEVREAVRQLDCLDLVEAMPDGFDTVVAERGSGLSHGQQQLVCFARAFLADPKILVLDEATSSVDTMTEARLQGALDTLLAGRTCFIIAHRLSTIRKANRVLVLDHGDIVERGDHASLLRQNGVYAGLYRQFAEV
jgi:ATP-binding cassette subfamily B protein